MTTVITTKKEEQIERLRELLKPGDIVYATVKHVSRSGMYRVLDLRLIRDSQPMRITGMVCEAMDYRYDRNHEGLGTSGCGMDMCFNTVYNLGRVLFPKGFKVPKGKYGRNGDTSGFDNDGGYALEYRSL